jgi:hypothetical protein
MSLKKRVRAQAKDVTLANVAIVPARTGLLLLGFTKKPLIRNPTKGASNRIEINVSGDISYPFKFSKNEIFTSLKRLNTATAIAKPMEASAAAMVMTKNTII